MKRFSPLLLLVFSIAFYACKKSMEETQLAYNSFEYTTLNNSKTSIDVKNDLKLILDNNKFVIKSDTLYITEKNGDQTTLSMFDLKTQKKLATAAFKWTIEVRGSQQEENLSDNITNLSVGKTYLYASSSDSKVLVFDKKTLKPITTIGQGVWWGQSEYNLVHSFATTEIGDKVYIRDKEYLVVFSLKDLTADNFRKVPILAKSKPLSYNRSMHGFNMVASSPSTIAITDYYNNKINLIDTAKITKGTDIDILENGNVISLQKAPTSLICLNGNKDFIVMNNDGTLDRYVENETTPMNLTAGLLQNQLATWIYRDKNDIWVLCGDGKIHKFLVENLKIKEYK